MKIHYACKDINNFGDIVPIYIYNKLGVKTKWVTADKAQVFAGGSIIQEVRSESTVLCCGFGGPDEVCEVPKKILSVRGPLTRNRLIELGIDCPEVYQDMVDYLPSFYNPKVEKKYKLGILPHYVDYEYCIGQFDESVLVIDICSGVENVINQILQCEHIKTSSLHGIIACNTYQINWSWFKHNELASPDYKFQDYFARIGVTGLKPEIL